MGRKKGRPGIDSRRKGRGRLRTVRDVSMGAPLRQTAWRDNYFTGQYFRRLSVRRGKTRGREFVRIVNF